MTYRRCRFTVNPKGNVPAPRPPLGLDGDANIKYLVYQLEAGDKTGTRHWQGFVQFTRAVRLDKIKQLFQCSWMNILPADFPAAARAYCMKEGRLEGPYEYGIWTPPKPGTRTDLTEAREIILGKRKRAELYQDPDLDPVMTKYPRWAENVLASKPIEMNIQLDLYQWQVEVLSMLEQDPVRRRIIWIWSSESGTGKTTFFDYCQGKFDVLPGAGQFTDVLYAYDNENVIWFDYSRAQSGREDYKALEKFSDNSVLLSTKFHSCKKHIQAHVVVTSNHQPDESRLPQRFVVIEANKQY